MLSTFNHTWPMDICTGLQTLLLRTWYLTHPRPEGGPDAVTRERRRGRPAAPAEAHVDGSSPVSEGPGRPHPAQAFG